MQQQQHHDGGYEKIKYITHLLAASFVSGAAAVTTPYHQKKASKTALTAPHEIFPSLRRTGSGRVGNIERFSHYVARQLGFLDANECPKMCKLAYKYLKNSEGCKDSIYEYFASEEDAESVYIEFTEELDRCILSYFAFHWSQTSHMISQVFDVESERRTKLKDYVLAATRKQRFERISKDLKVTRVFSTLVEEMKVIGSTSKGESKCTEVMKPMAHSERSPVLLLMGGGMGAGKSTVLKDILKEPFWTEAKKTAVVVEADAFKETDVLYRALSLKGHHHDMLQSAELVHQSSTDAASSLLVTALNEGRDVIMDGTLSWAPFVDQTIAMARNVHNCRYRMGVGYKVADDGTITENYWEQVSEEEEDEHQKLEKAGKPQRKPYRIELVGVVCDAYLAVIRGIRRAIMIHRAVRVNSQIQSHRRFASAFTGYCQLVDNARLYCTNAMAGPPKLIGWKNGDNNLLVDPEEIKCLTDLSHLNSKADSIYELYTHNPGLILEPGSVWKEAVLSPARPSIQRKLKGCIQRIEISSITADELS
ncbi:calmodulin calcium-dependent NAD kinase-like [Rosa rugosa]|uniref:calmodulin calcium-dependent NAD kinase-like n=1 Tax=Rosa rugosa TaxID=74645 RepID=UPI002B402BED|nr:calmodulin calcium-dependent NAD kinase-like [Rosa rugosa]